MKAIFVQVKCHMGEAYATAGAIIEIEGVSEVYSTSGHFDLLVKCHIDDDTDTGLFVTKHIQTVEGVQDTLTIITFNAFAT